MKAVVIFALLALSAFSYDIKTKQTSFVQTSTGVQNAMNQLKKTSTGATLMNLAEVQMLTGGPLEDLIKAIDDLSASNGQALEADTAQFNKDVARHNSEVSRLNVLINAAKLDISNTQSKLNNVLYPRRESLEGQIEDLKRQIQETKDTIAAETKQRADELAKFLVEQKETEGVIQACGEALDLLRQLQNGQVSLAQVRVAQKAMKKIQDRLNNLRGSPLGEFVLALTELAQNFADQDAVTRVINLIANVRDNATSFLAEIRKNENDAKVQWETVRLPQLQKDLANFEAALAQAQDDLQKTKEAIATAEAFLAKRKDDLAKETENLDNENKYFDVRQNSHKALVERLNAEISACTEAANLLKSQSFTDYFNTNVNKF